MKMALVPHKITALAESDEQGTDGKNIVAGAIVVLYDTSGEAAVLYDDENGANGSTVKQTDANGVVVVYVEEGEYDEQVNNGIKRRVLIGSKSNNIVSYGTTAEIESLRPQRTGSRVEVRGNSLSQYTLQAEGYTALDPDVVAANGRVWKFEGNIKKPVNFSEWSESPNTTIVRHAYLPRKIYSAETLNDLPRGFCVGNSIMQGTGSSNILNTIPWKIGAKLQSLNSAGTLNEWTPLNRAVGGSTTMSVCQYVSDNADTLDYIPESGELTKGKDYCLMLTMRNDATAFAQGDLRHAVSVLRSTLQQITNKGVEVIFIVDPPKIDISTGEILDTQENWGVLYDRYLSVAAENNCTLVDVWKHLKRLYDSGVDIRQYYSDGVHPNDAGHELIAELTFQAMISQPEPKEIAPAPQMRQVYSDCVSAYDATGGDVTTTTTITGLVTNSTARKTQTGESTVEAFVLTDGQKIRFEAPSACQGVIVNMLGGESGYVTANYAFVNLPTNFGAESGVVRERATLSRFIDGVVPFNLKSRLELTSVGTSRVLGVTFLCDRITSYYDKWIDANEVGTWSDSALVDSSPCRESSTIGNTATLRVYGSSLYFHYVIGVSYGSFSYSVDGGAPKVIDCYLNAAAQDRRELVILESEGWHTIEFEILEKNASSLNNRVRLGRFVEASKIGSPTKMFGAFNQNGVDTRIKYEDAEIVKTVAGSPTAYDALSGTSITLNNAGAAVVKLTR